MLGPRLAWIATLISTALFPTRHQYNKTYWWLVENVEMDSMSFASCFKVPLAPVSRCVLSLQRFSHCLGSNYETSTWCDFTKQPLRFCGMRNPTSCLELRTSFQRRTKCLQLSKLVSRFIVHQWTKAEHNQVGTSGFCSYVVWLPTWPTLGPSQRRYSGPLYRVISRHPLW